MSLKETIEKYSGRKLNGLVLEIRRSESLKSELQEATSFLPSEASLSERLFCIIHKIAAPLVCPYCKTKLRKFMKLDKGYSKTCGDEACKAAGMSKGAKKPRDWDKISAKAKKTFESKTGFSAPMRDPKVAAKVRETCLEKYGVTSGVETPEAVKSRQEAFMQKYGSLDVIGAEIEKKYGSRKALATETAKKRSAALRAAKLKEFEARLEEFDFKLVSYDDDWRVRVKCEKCGHEFSSTRPSMNYWLRNGKRCCPKCNFKDMTFRSGFEREVGEEVKKFWDGDLQFNKWVGGCECDILIEDKKIAVDANGVWFHNELYKKREAHIEKKRKVEAEGWSFIQIWEDDWRDEKKRKIILSRLKSKLGLSQRIYARKTEMKEVSGAEARAFLEENHLQGWVPSTLKLGLLYEGELVEIVTVGKSRKLIGKGDTEELLRLCSKIGVEVVGGFSKLMSGLKKLGVHDLMSYADLDWASLDGGGYKKAGFKKVRETGPDYVWVVDGKRMNRLNFTKKKLVERGADSSLSEADIMHAKKSYRIFGTGNLVLEASL